MFVVTANNRIAQDVTPRPLTMEEYEKAKSYTVKDLDKDTYVKFGPTMCLTVMKCGNLILSQAMMV